MCSTFPTDRPSSPRPPPTEECFVLIARETSISWIEQKRSSKHRERAERESISKHRERAQREEGETEQERKCRPPAGGWPPMRNASECGGCGRSPTEMHPSQGPRRGPALACLLCEHGLLSHPAIAGPLVSALAQSGCIALAGQSFDRLDPPGSSSFNSLVIAYVKYGDPGDALSLHRYVQGWCSVRPSIHAFVALLKACAGLHDLRHGCELHAEIARRGLFKTNCYVGSALVDMYAKCRFLCKAQEVFSGLQEKNDVCWTALISGYADNGYAEEALRYFGEMEAGGVPLDAVTFVCALKACASLCDTCRGQVIHSQILKRGLEKDVVVGSTLVVMYAKGGLLTTAHDVFDRLLDRDVVLWSTLIAAYAEAGLGQEALEFYNSMQCMGVCPDQAIFVSVLKACDNIRAIHEVHLEICKKGMEQDSFISNTLLDVYMMCGLFVDGHTLLNKNFNRTVVSWNALLTGYTDNGQFAKVLGCFTHMQLDKTAPDSVTYTCFLKACSAAGDLTTGYNLHGEIVKRGLEMDAAIGSSLIDMYGKCGYLVDAHELFDNLVMQDAVSWNALITGYADHGHGFKAINCLEVMRKQGLGIQVVTLIGGLRACGCVKAFDQGREIHAELVIKGLENSPLLAGSLVDMYVKCGSLEDAQNVFYELSCKDVVLWNILLVGFVDHECWVSALEHFEEMWQEGVCPDHVSYMCSLKACSSLGLINKGYALHSEIMRKGWDTELFVANTLVDMYRSGGMLVEAQKMFDYLQIQSVASWNALIVGYAEHGHESEALNCFEKMQSGGLLVDLITLLSTLKACGTGGFIEKTQKIHFEIIIKGFDADVSIRNMLVDTYSKCGLQTDAVNVFDMLLDKTVASWNTLIGGKMEAGNFEEALSCLETMQIEGTSPDDLTFVCCLRACGSLGIVMMAQKVHKEVIQRGLESDAFIGNTVIDTYSKAGLLDEALYLCNKLSVPTLYSWNAVITGYAQQGDRENVFVTFHRMMTDEIDPNAVTFVGILNVCNHAGDTGSCHIHYESMTTQFCIVSTLQHLTCVVDLLGRLGHIDWAAAVIHDMPFHPGLVIWHTVLAACRKWSDPELGRCAFEHALQSNHLKAATYVCMSNIYVDLDAE